MKRIFIGLPVQSTRAVQLASRWSTDPQININRMAWTKPSNWHVTLYFLGPTAETDILAIRHLIDSAFLDLPSFSSRLNGVGVFPEKGRARILWLGLDNLQPIEKAYTMLGELLLKNGFLFDPKPLKPHLTLARVKSLVHPDSIHSLLSNYQSFDFGNVEINRITLFESLSTANGVIYQPLHDKWLGNSAI